MVRSLPLVGQGYRIWLNNDRVMGPQSYPSPREVVGREA
jgi:hypothetical protein